MIEEPPFLVPSWFQWWEVSDWDFQKPAFSINAHVGIGDGKLRHRRIEVEMSACYKEKGRETSGVTSLPASENK